MKNPANMTAADVTAWLGWYETMGGAVWCQDEPTNWFDAEQARRERASAPRTAPASRSSPAERAKPALAPDSTNTPAPARKAAAPSPPPVTVAPLIAAPVDAVDLAALRSAIAAFDGCPLKATAKNLCFYRGSPQAPVMVIGEAPGRDEDLAGSPFVGPAGHLLNAMLASIDLAETDVHITNVVYWRPPGNRVPTASEVRACLPFLMRQIDLVNPRLLLILGGVAAQNLLQTDLGITKLRGKWKSLAVGGRDIPLLPSLHPAYLLRTPLAKRQAWADLLALKTRLDAG
jgi:uracil-DNA glycosylase